MAFRQAVIFYLKSHISRIVVVAMSQSPTFTPRRASHLAREITALQQTSQSASEDAAARRETFNSPRSTPKQPKLAKLQAQARSLYDMGVRNGTKCVKAIQ